jgi:hypothetical protein
MNSNVYQTRSKNRKLIYGGLIVSLFLITLLLRGVRLGSVAAANTWTVRGQADTLKLSTLSRGDTNLSGNAIRLLLTGSQGLVTCGLWMAADELKKNHEWNKLEILVDSVTQLQPYFTTPWLFQSWNLTYNVSVENDQLNDMYFYIARGISLLAEGESINTNNPDLRYTMGFYYQNKFSVADTVNTLRCMYNLSCIPLTERKADDLLNDDRETVNSEKFEAFCRKNPQLVRRLRESTVALNKPIDIVKFLRDNDKIPNRYKEGTTLESPLRQFPVLPPPLDKNEADELNPRTVISDREADALLAARAWFRHSMLPLPPPTYRPVGTPTDEMKAQYRIPKSPALIIFLQGASRAQSYVATRLQEEGWHDNDPWKVDEYFDSGDPNRWFEREIALDPSMNSQESWQKSYRMWSDHGNKHGLDYDKSTLANMREKAIRFAAHRGISPDQSSLIYPPVTPEELADPELKESYEALYDLIILRQNLNVTNFKYFLYSAQAESTKETVDARKLLFAAEWYRRLNRSQKAIGLFEQGFDAWKKVMIAHPYFHRGEDGSSREGDKMQEDTYEIQINYMRLKIGTQLRKRQEAVLALHDIMNSAGAAAARNPMQLLGDLYATDAVLGTSNLVQPLEAMGPFDDNDPKGIPWILPEIRERVKQRLAGIKPANPAGAPGAGGGPAQ